MATPLALARERQQRSETSSSSSSTASLIPPVPATPSVLPALVGRQHATVPPSPALPTVARCRIPLPQSFPPPPSPPSLQSRVITNIKRSLANDGTCSSLYMPIISNCLDKPDPAIAPLQRLFPEWPMVIAAYKADFSVRGITMDTLTRYQQSRPHEPLYLPAHVQERLLDSTADDTAHRRITTSASLEPDAYQTICQWVQRFRNL